MQATIEMGGKQFTVNKDQVFYTDLLKDEKVGNEIKISNVLMVDNEGSVSIGKPYLSSASVTAKILEEVKGPKINGFTYKNRKNQHKRWGHRQKYVKIQVTDISA